MLNTNLFLRLTRRETDAIYLRGKEYITLQVRPAVICKDGFQISIQASESHYCTPRTNTEKEYTAVELGYPSEPDDIIKEYAEDSDQLTRTVYGWVPVTVVDELLEKHGGIVDITRDYMK